MSAVLAAVLLAAVVLVLPPRRRGGTRVPPRPPGPGVQGRPPAGVAGLAGASGAPGRRRPLTTSDVADVMVLLAVALRSGCGMTESVEAVAAAHDDDPGGPLADQLHAVAAALRWGVAPYAAWTAADPAWRRVATVLAVASRAGTAPGPPLLRAARDLRADEAARVEVAAARAGVRLVAPLGLVFLPAFVLTTLVPVVLALGRRVLG